jgi:predicted ATPase
LVTGEGGRRACGAALRRAGLGKSRLGAAPSETIAGERQARLYYFCSPHHRNSALYPFTLQLERAAGFARDAAEPCRRAEPQPAAQAGVPFEALLRQIVALARRRPVLMVFEDVHWIDPTSRELPDLSLDRVADCRCC